MSDATGRSRIQLLAAAAAFVCLILGGALIVRQAWTPEPDRVMPSALGAFVMGIGIWLVWQWRQRESAQSNASADRIVSASAAILIVVASFAGISGFEMLEMQTESANAHVLDQATLSRVAMFNDRIREAQHDAAELARLPGLIDPKRKPANARGGAAGEKNPSVLRDAIAGAFRAAAITSPDGMQIAREGKPMDVSSIEVPLDSAGNASLLWDQGFVLHVHVPIESASGHVTGTLVVERALPELTERFNDVAGLGLTADILVCARVDAARVRCFPHGSTAATSDLSLATTSGHPPPMSLALQGRSGSMTAMDEHGHETLAAYAPLLTGRLGLLVHEDTDEIFAPIRDRLLWMVPILIGLITFGMLLLRSRVRPLAERIITSEIATREAHDQVAAIVGTIVDGLITADASSRILMANPAAERMFGYPEGGLVGRDFYELLPREFHPPRSSGLNVYTRDGTTRNVGHSIALIGLHRDGTQFPIELTMNTIERSDGRRFVGVIRDASVRQRAGKALLLEKERLRVTLHSIGDAVITTDTQGTINFLNPVAEHLTGWTGIEAVGQRIEAVYSVIRTEFGDKAANPVDFVLSTGAVGGMSGETALVRRDGSRVDVEDSASPIRDGEGKIVGVVLVFRDATQARRLTGHIHHQATHDALTDLANRREFERNLTATLNGEGLQEQGHVLLFIDLDQFKIVNDTAGHAAGDKLLKQVSGLLKSKLRNSDLLARMGGDEFAVLLRDCPLEPGIRIAEALRQVVADIRFDWEGTIFRIGASIGLVHFEAGAAIAQLLSEADSACYLAKDQGRNRVYVHHAENEDVMRRSGELNWTSRIHAALADGRFLLYAQKIVPVSGMRGRETHYELLVRMRDEYGELVPPMAFIPAAERYGLMPAIDRWVVAHAFENLATARKRGASNLMFSINLSGATLGDNGFVDFVEDQFRMHQIPHAQICFEITETTAITNLIRTGRLIERLKGQGCKFSLDDFGSGMSSFTYLKNLQVDFLKIDGSFVKNIVKDEVDASMVDAINRVGHVMGIKTIAEFVEDDPTLQRLRFIGVDFAQGYAVEVPCPLASVLSPEEAADIAPSIVDVPAPGSRVLGMGARWNAR